MIDVVNSFEINSDCEVKRVLAIIIIVIVTILDMPNIVCDLCVPAGKQIHQQLPKLLRVISTVHPHPSLSFSLSSCNTFQVHMQQMQNVQEPVLQIQ